LKKTILNRLHYHIYNDWKTTSNLSYEEFVYRLSFTNYNYKQKDFDIVTLAGKIKKDINGYTALPNIDHVAAYLDVLPNFI